MVYEIKSNVKLDALTEASRKLGEEIAKAHSETYDPDKHLELGHSELKRRIEERMAGIEVDIIDEVLNKDGLDLAAQ